MDKNNTILLQDYKIKDKIYIRNIEIRRNGNTNYIVHEQGGKKVKQSVMTTPIKLLPMASLL